jgi:hypothetical protein
MTVHAFPPRQPEIQTASCARSSADKLGKNFDPAGRNTSCANGAGVLGATSSRRSTPARAVDDVRCRHNVASRLHMETRRICHPPGLCPAISMQPRPVYISQRIPLSAAEVPRRRTNNTQGLCTMEKRLGRDPGVLYRRRTRPPSRDHVKQRACSSSTVQPHMLPQARRTSWRVTSTYARSSPGALAARNGPRASRARMVVERRTSRRRASAGGPGAQAFVEKIVGVEARSTGSASAAAAQTSARRATGLARRSLDANLSVLTLAADLLALLMRWDL